MKIICIEQNYIAEQNYATPQEPIFFLKPESCLLKNNKDFWLANFSENFQHELEIVFKIGKLGKCIQEKFAYRYIETIALGINITARDLQNKCQQNGLPWEISKCFDGSAVISDFIPFENFNNINFSLYKNEQLVQKGNSSEMIFSIFKIIEYVSKFMTLKIGDIIYSGTPQGVNKLNIGDNLKGFIENMEVINFKIK